MIYTKAVYILLINIILLQCCVHTLAYTQISSNMGSGGTDDRSDGGGGGPKIYKAVNFDLIFPKSFNSSENVISTTPETIPLPTKTSSSSSGSTYVGQPYYPLPQSSNEPARDVERQEPTLFITPAPPPLALATTAPSNEAGIYDTQQQQQQQQQQNYNAQVVTQNAINIQQQQQQQLNDNNKAEKELKQQQLQQQQQQQQYLATGRAVDYHAGYPFGQLITPLIKNAPRPVYRKPVTSYSTFPSSSSSVAAAKLAAPSNVGKIIYPQAMYQQKPPSQAEIDKLRGKGTFGDRFSPSEGVASHTFKSNHDHSHDHSHDHNHHNHNPTYTQAGKTASASNMVNSYVAPSNLYSFPPNNVNYPTQAQDTKIALASGTVNSYSAPASGPLKNSNYNLDTSSSNSSPYQYNGPISAGYLPPSNDNSNNGDAKEEGKNTDGGGDGDLDNGGGDDSVGVLPASAMDQINDGGNSDGNGDMSGDMGGGDMAGDMAASMDSQDAPDDSSYDTGKEYPTPPPSWLKEHPEAAQEHPPRKPDIEFDHSHDHHHKPDIIFDHDYYHHSYPSYPIYHHHYPEVIYDDHHHDHSHVEPPPPTTTTEAPPPEPPPEPRVKKYSYFYIGRKLWYIPLYFTIWFSFYVLWLILKSIARHKVNLPNHYVSRRSVNYDFSKNKQETLNQLTVSVLDQIDKFKRKYLN
ncbi:myb-like protein AA [Lucilia sericata]|uniref:myb-like protein AA n=1 Tax=Lucilia sericata TaxID=13632 RepID=UPI0018A84460|nr:myb-like protein AA [Lucilia sericata]